MFPYIQESFAGADPTAAHIVGRDRLFCHLNLHPVESMLAAATRLASVLKISGVSRKLKDSENDRDVSVVPPAGCVKKIKPARSCTYRLQDQPEDAAILQIRALSMEPKFNEFLMM